MPRRALPCVGRRRDPSRAAPVRGRTKLVTSRDASSSTPVRRSAAGSSGQLPSVAGPSWSPAGMPRRALPCVGRGRDRSRAAPVRGRTKSVTSRDASSSSPWSAAGSIAGCSRPWPDQVGHQRGCLVEHSRALVGGGIHRGLLPSVAGPSRSLAGMPRRALPCCRSAAGSIAGSSRPWPDQVGHQRGCLVEHSRASVSGGIHRGLLPTVAGPSWSPAGIRRRALPCVGRGRDPSRAAPVRGRTKSVTSRDASSSSPVRWSAAGSIAGCSRPWPDQVGHQRGCRRRQVRRLRVGGQPKRGSQ